MTNITELTAKLKAAALAATPGEWRYLKTTPFMDAEISAQNSTRVVNLLAGDVTEANSEFIALASPANILALTEALEAAELAAVKNWWKPARCPVTNRPFFLWLEHPTDGMVPTYGGPYDSYTIPTLDSDGEFCCERYDHDEGAWVDSECLSVRLTDEQEDAEKRIASLEARTLTVKLPDSCEHDVMAPVAAFMYEDGYEFDQEDYTAVAGRVRSELETVLRRALRAAGIKLQIEGE